jgi:hypothetical protein
VRRAENLTIFMCRLSLNLGASNSWNPMDLSKPVIALPLRRRLSVWNGLSVYSLTADAVDWKNFVPVLMHKLVSLSFDVSDSCNT